MLLLVLALAHVALTVTVFLFVLRIRATAKLRVGPTAALVITHTPGNHSPRAFAHATAILDVGLTDVVVYAAQRPRPTERRGIHFIDIPVNEQIATRRSTLSIFVRLVHLTRSIIFTIYEAFRAPFTVSVIIVNTPPVLPVLPVVALLRPFFFPASRLIVDVHNPAFTLMSLTSPPIVVRIGRFAEGIVLHTADAHLTVSCALSNFLKENFYINAVTLRDKPQSRFIAACRSNDNFQLQQVLREHATITASPNHPIHNILSRQDTLTRSLPVLVSSSSWTPDEDFSILLKALPKMDSYNIPLLVLLTGKGPGREAFMLAVASLNLRHVAVAFAWVPTETYPRLLAHATLGICLHASSSGVDLPMKVVDMLGAGLPVLALRFPAISELVTSKVGHLFDNSDDLLRLIVKLVFLQPEWLSQLRTNIRHVVDTDDDWLAHWRRHALSVVRGT